MYEEWRSGWRLFARADADVSMWRYSSGSGSGKGADDEEETVTWMMRRPTPTRDATIGRRGTSPRSPSAKKKPPRRRPARRRSPSLRSKLAVQASTGILVPVPVGMVATRCALPCIAAIAHMHEGRRTSGAVGAAFLLATPA